MATRMKLITNSEINYIKDLLEEMTVLADPNEYSREEVVQACNLLDSLVEIDTEAYTVFVSGNKSKATEETLDDQ
jgi:hypothetical protein